MAFEVYNWHGRQEEEEGESVLLMQLLNRSQSQVSDSSGERLKRSCDVKGEKKLVESEPTLRLIQVAQFLVQLSQKVSQLN